MLNITVKWKYLSKQKDYQQNDKDGDDKADFMPKLKEDDHLIDKGM